ncbi:MAG TPA: hypothetical protein PKW63_01535 [Vicinamibacterales bacterium]|nr:hypothetical protein [Vicinamibacterales bacterium]
MIVSPPGPRKGNQKKSSKKNGRSEKSPDISRVPVRYLNSTVVLTHVAESACIPTADPYDRAHNVNDGSLDRMLLPNARKSRYRPASPLMGSKPRKYHPSQLNSHGVAADSSFDWLYKAQKRLEGVPGIGSQDCRTSVASVRDRVLAQMGGDRPIRNAIQRRTYQLK